MQTKQAAGKSFLFDNAIDLPEGKASIEATVVEGDAAAALVAEHFGEAV